MPSISFEVICNKHGVQQAGANYNHKCVYVGAPKHKKIRYGGGCPKCKAEARQASRNG